MSPPINTGAGRAAARTTPARWLLGLLLVLAGPGLPPAQAQLLPGLGPPAEPAQAPAEPTKNDVARPEAAAIPVERIPMQMEQSRELSRRALEAARPRAEVEAVRAQLAAHAASIEALDDRILTEAFARADMRTLEGALEQITSLRQAIAGSQAPLTRHAEELSDWREQLRHGLQSWTLTEDALDAGDLPRETLANIKTTQGSLRDAAKRIGERQQEVLELQSVLANSLSVVDERRGLVVTELSRARVELFRPEHPPIWQGQAGSLGLGTFQERWRNDHQTLKNYLLARQGNAWAHLVLLVLLLFAFAMLSRKVHLWAETRPELARDLAVFRQPLAAALLLAILAAPWLYPDAPMVFRDFLGVLLILPLLRVMSRVVSPSLRGALYLLAGLYLLMRLDGLLGAGTALERYSLLLLTAATAFAVAWMFRPAGPGAKLEAGRWWRAARLAARLGLVVLGAALLANIGGLVSLSGLLTNGVISSGFVAVVLFAGVVVTRATLIALFQTRPMQHLNLVRWHASAIDQRVLQLLSLIALLGWLLTTARLFRIDDWLGQVLGGVLFTSATIGTVEISLGDILGFGLAIWIGLMLSRLLRFVLTVDVFPRVTLPRGVAATISMLINYTVLGIAFVLAVAAAGIQLDRFALIVGALSVGIGFGLQNIVNNFVSGLILAFERPVQSGDTVQFSSMFGKVTRIGVRSSTVRTFDGAEVIVPNANLISNEVTNWTLSDLRRRMEILVGVAYGSNPHQVMELLLNVAKANEHLLETPAPNVLFLGFGDSSLDFSLRAWTDEFDNFLTIKSDLTLAVHDALYAARIEIPFPQRDLHLRSVDPQAVARIGAVQAPPVGAGDDKDDRAP
jgi:small-conductance mechanosensitive channel